MKSFLLLVFSTLAVCCSAQKTQYNVVPRGHRQQHHRVTQDGLVPSFDGDLDRIINMALARAAENASSAPTVTPSPTSSPTLSPTVSEAPSVSESPSVSNAPSLTPVHSPNTCPGGILNRLVIFNWKYTIEAVPGADIDTVIGEVEEILQENLIPVLLQCNNADAVNGTVVAIDGTFPRDTVSVDSK